MRPAPRLLYLASAWLFIALLAVFFEPARWVWMGSGLVLFAACAADMWLLSRLARVEAKRHMPSSLPLGIWTDVQLDLWQTGDEPLSVQVFDGCPPAAEFEGLPLEADIPAVGDGIQHTYRLRALKRGDMQLGLVQVLRSSPGALWLRRELIGEESQVRVYPNFAAVQGFALHGVDNRISLMGIRKKPRRGQGLDFHQLRDYVDSDALRQIDWKATSRRGKTISKEFQEERDQQVIFLVDCGRRMRSMDGELEHFDHTLNALLLLSYIALRQGDAVGVMTFSGHDRWLPPAKGNATLNSILNRVYDLEPTLSPPDYSEAATRVLTLQRRRALVILMTNLRDEDFGDLQPALSLLRRRHLVVLASLRESKVDKMMSDEAVEFDAALTACSAMEYTAARRTAVEKMSGRNLISLDLPASELPVALVKRYLDIKRSGIL